MDIFKRSTSTDSADSRTTIPTMDTSDNSSRYGHDAAQPQQLKSYEKFILEVQGIMQRRLERAAADQGKSNITSKLKRSGSRSELAEQEIEAEIVYQLLSHLQQTNHENEITIQTLNHQLNCANKDISEYKSKVSKLSKRCAFAETELRELRASKSTSKKNYIKKSSSGTSVTKTITDKSFDGGDIEGGSGEGIPNATTSSCIPEVIGIPSSLKSSTSLSECQKLLEEYELRESLTGHTYEDDELDSSDDDSSTDYSEFIEGGEGCFPAVNEQDKASLSLEEAGIIKKLHEACEGFQTKEVEEENGSTGNSAHAFDDIDVIPNDGKPQRRLSDYGGALEPILETPAEDILAQQEQAPPSPTIQASPPPIMSNIILENSSIGTKYDSRGRCINHPHVQLRKKKKKSLLPASPSKNNAKVEWKIKYKNCPDCCIEHLNMLEH